MTPVTPRVSPREAWHPLSRTRWNAGRARHLLRRAGFSVSSAEVRTSLRLGMNETVGHMFANPPPLPVPPSITALEAEIDGHYQRIRAAESREERQRLNRELNERRNEAYRDMSLSWLRYASRSENAPHANWVAFLLNVFVVSFDQIRQPHLVFRHHELLHERARDDYAEVCKAVSRSAAMIRYLDLDRSSAERPNENFARELFELFLLGEGAYTEEDVREAARAFTGYRQISGEFRLRANLHDSGRKTIFGETGRFDGDGVIDLAIRQPAARTHIPAEACRHYLSDAPLPSEYLEELGRLWANSGYNLGFLVRRILTSRIFYEPEFRGGLIKSPFRYYLGLLGDLRLDVPPYPRPVITPFRQMGQALYSPPNVRGWLGGRLWINSNTLSARRSLVEAFFSEVNEERLNADDLAALREARKTGPVVLSVSRARLRQLANSPPEDVVDRFLRYFLPGAASPEFRDTLVEHLSGSGDQSINRIRTVAMALLQSPQYNLC